MEKRKKPQTKEQIYDALINPLMAQILAVCKEHKIAMVASFSIPNEDDPNLAWTSVLTTDEYDPPEMYREIVRMFQRVNVSPMMITTRDSSGEIKSMTAVLP